MPTNKGNTKFKKGQVAWNRGIKLTDIEKKKISESTKLAMSNPLIRKKLKDNHKGNLGKHFTEDHKRKIGEAQIGEKNHRFGKSPWNKGKHPFSKETKEKIGKFHIGNSYRKGGHHTKETKELLRKYRLGTKLAKKTRIKMSKTAKLNIFLGKCHLWKGGITEVNLAIRKGIDFKLWREAVFKRDNYTCQRCSSNKSGTLNPHHIKNFSKYVKLRFVISNGITLCKKCHNEFHKRYSVKNNTKKQIEKFLIS